MIGRDKGMQLIHGHLAPEAIVVAGLGTTARAWRAQAPRQATYYVSDPMGLGLSMALGMALAQPDRTVVFMGGDGDLLMSLSTLLTITEADPENLKIVVLHNSRYETGGGQPLAASGKSSLATIARGAGWAHVHEAFDEAGAGRVVPAFLAEDARSILVMHTRSEPSPYPEAGPWSQSEHRAFFMHQLHGDQGVSW